MPFSFHTQSTHHTTLSHKDKISNKIPTPKPGSPEHANSARCSTMPDVPPCQMCHHARSPTFARNNKSNQKLGLKKYKKTSHVKMHAHPNQLQITISLIKVWATMNVIFACATVDNGMCPTLCVIFACATVDDGMCTTLCVISACATVDNRMCQTLGVMFAFCHQNH